MFTTNEILAMMFMIVASGLNFTKKLKIKILYYTKGFGFRLIFIAIKGDFKTI
jgi:hypothetical protein